MEHVRNFREGDPVVWEYIHTIGRNRFRRYKEGIVVRRYNRKNKHKYNYPFEKTVWRNEYMVLLEGNIKPTICHENNLRHKVVTAEIFKRK